MTLLQAVKAVLSFIKSVFLSGLFTIIPIAATIFFINFMYNFLSRMIAPIVRYEPAYLRAIPGVEFAIVMAMILIIGFVLKVFIAHQIIHYFERLVARIPLVRIVYSSAKILVDFFKVPVKPTTLKRQVVLIPYPQKGQYHLAFLLEGAEESYTRIIPDGFKHYPEERYVKIFMPHSPNPTGGFFFIMPEDSIIYTDISFEEAIKTLVSCGLITPESIKNVTGPSPQNFQR